jgi:hypothetical protein
LASAFGVAWKNGQKVKSEINAVDCLQLKQNYAWWLFSGKSLSFEDFQLSCRSPILHHFNDHSTCGTSCKHRGKSESELVKFKSTGIGRPTINYTF